MKKTLSDFTFVTDVPKDTVVTPAFLGGDWGKIVHDEIVAKHGENNRLVTSNVYFSDNLVRGSKPGYVVAANEFLRQEGLRTASPADVEMVLQAGMDLRGTYEDTALVLRNQDNPNSYLANHLMNEAKRRLGDALGDTIVIPLSDLEIVGDKNSEYNSRFHLREDAELIDAPELDHANNYRKFSQTNENGLPIVNPSGNRTLYTRDSGLSRLYLYIGLGLYSDDAGLGNSNGSGRVVVVSGEATSKKNSGETNQ